MTIPSPHPVWWAVAGAVAIGLVTANQSAPTPTHAMEVAAAPAVIVETNRPNELSGEDLGLYALIFEAEERGDTARSNTLMEQLHNRNLVGYALATRYLNASYKPTAEELTVWLNAYSDHPQAARIARLASKRGVKVVLPKAEQPLKGDGYTDHLGRSTMPDSWFSALGAWREGDFRTAQNIFTKLAKSDELSEW
ncbi:MAG: hypothetical protein ACOYNL_06115 [Rickettsiales bacterium]